MDSYSQPTFKGILVPKSSEYGKYIPEIANQIKGKSILEEHKVGHVLGYIEDATILSNGDLEITGRLSSEKALGNRLTEIKAKWAHGLLRQLSVGFDFILNQAGQYIIKVIEASLCDQGKLAGTIISEIRCSVNPYKYTSISTEIRPDMSTPTEQTTATTQTQAPSAAGIEAHLANLPGDVVDALQRVLAENNTLKAQNQERDAMLADYRTAYANEQRPFVEKLSKIATEYNKGVEDPIIGSTLKELAESPNDKNKQMWRFLVNLTKDYDTYKDNAAKHDELLKQRASEKAFSAPQPIAVRNSAKPTSSTEEAAPASILANVVKQFNSTKRLRVD